MDILKARKKAAERKHAGKKTKPREPVAAPEPAKIEETSAAPVSAPTPGAPVVSTAIKPDAPAAEETELELLSFQLGTERYAIPVSDVREVLKNRILTMVPNAPAYIAGVTSLRGTVLPVIDLCKRLAVPAGTRDEKSKIVVVSCDEELAGIVVDRVTGVLRIMSHAIEPLPDHVKEETAFLSGVARKDDRLYILLNLEKAVGA